MIGAKMTGLTENVKKELCWVNDGLRHSCLVFFNNDITSTNLVGLAIVIMSYLPLLLTFLTGISEGSPQVSAANRFMPSMLHARSSYAVIRHSDTWLRPRDLTPTLFICCASSSKGFIKFLTIFTDMRWSSFKSINESIPFHVLKES